MKNGVYALRLAFAASLVLILGCVSAFPVQADTTYSGRAVAASVGLPALGANGVTPIYLSDSGELSPAGGSQSSSLFTGTVPGVLSASLLNASTSGASGMADSSSSLITVDVLPGSQAHLQASFVRSQSAATCDALTGSSEIADLRFGGQSVTVRGQPNQTVTIPGVATLIINEQTKTANGNHGEIRVNAIHLIVPGVAEVILASSKSDIDCVPPTRKGPCHDFVSGGGWVTGTPTGSKGHFSFNVGFKDGAVLPTGHFHYIDQGSSLKVQSTAITEYGVRDDRSTVRHFKGTCDINGQAGTFDVEVNDNGEPGRSDTFSVTLNGGSYTAAGTAQGGNVQLHAPCSR